MNTRATSGRAAVSAFMLAVLALCAGVMGDASAQAYPAKPVRVIVPFPPGGGIDVPARIILPRMSESLGQNLIIDNRPGGNGLIGAGAAAKAAPDGYTLLIVPRAHTVNPSLIKDMPFDTVKDFSSVSLIANAAYFLAVSTASPVKSVKELIALAKTKPMNYGFGGAVGGANHLAGALFVVMSGTQIQSIPYKGGGPMLADLLGGHIDSMFGAVGTLSAEVRSGKVRPLAVTTAVRSLAFPEVPTVAESGLAGYDVGGWYAMLGPAGLPGAIAQRVSNEVNKAVMAPDIKEKLVSGLGLEPVGSTPAALDALIRKEIPQWAEVVNKLGIKGEDG